MAQTYSSREDIKKDPLQEWTRISLEWIAANRQTFFSIAGTVAVVVIIFAFMVANFHNLRKQAWEKYSSGQNWVYANKPANAIGLFNEVLENYSHTPAATYALLSKGNVLYSQKNYPEAIDSFKKCLERNPPKIILPFVLTALGSAQEDSGDYASAIATYKKVISDFPDHYLSPKMYESLARAYELSLNPDAAKEVYEKIITMFPGTYWSEKARQRYHQISPEPFQNMPAEKPE